MNETRKTSKLAMPSQTHWLMKALASQSPSAQGVQDCTSPISFMPLPRSTFPTDANNTMGTNNTMVFSWRECWETMKAVLILPSASGISSRGRYGYANGPGDSLPRIFPPLGAQAEEFGALVVKAFAFR